MCMHNELGTVIVLRWLATGSTAEDASANMSFRSLHFTFGNATLVELGGNTQEKTKEESDK